MHLTGQRVWVNIEVMSKSSQCVRNVYLSEIYQRKQPCDRKTWASSMKSILMYKVISIIFSCAFILLCLCFTNTGSLTRVFQLDSMSFSIFRLLPQHKTVICPANTDTRHAGCCVSNPKTDPDLQMFASCIDVGTNPVWEEERMWEHDQGWQVALGMTAHAFHYSAPVHRTAKLNQPETYFKIFSTAFPSLPWDLWLPLSCTILLFIGRCD